MIKDYTTDKTKFIQMKINTPDGRFSTDFIRGGLEKKSALFEAKKYNKEIIIELFNSND